MNPRIFLLTAFTLAAASVAQVPAGYAGKPYKDVIQSVPGILQPELYDEGGAGVTWYDTDAHIGGHNARNPTGVDLDPVAARDPTVPGSTVQAKPGDVYWGWLANNEWLKMTVDVKQAGAYSIHAMVGTAMTGTSFRVDAYQGTDSASSGALTLPFGGSCPIECYHYWNYAQNLGTITLKAGIQVIKLQIVRSGYNLEYVELKAAGATGVSPGSIAPRARPAPTSPSTRFRFGPRMSDLLGRLP
jgi:hypothetical protein